MSESHSPELIADTGKWSTSLESVEQTHTALHSVSEVSRRRERRNEQSYTSLTLQKSHSKPHRVAFISMHTSPLAQAGCGDAGGMNVYILSTARELARKGVKVEIFTRAVSSKDEALIEVTDGVWVHNIQAGPYEGLPKEELPAQLCAFTVGMLRVGAARPSDYFDVIHSHYWLSGHVGYLAKDRWSVPLVHTAHTLAAVKNRYLAAGDKPEPQFRIMGEQQVVLEADRLIVNTAREQQELIDEYLANPAHIDIVPPGVDTGIFYPGAEPKLASQVARMELGLDSAAFIIGFVGRIQPLKGFDTLITALAYAREHIDLGQTDYSELKIIIVGGISGNAYSDEDIIDLITELGVKDHVIFYPAMPQNELVKVYRACNLVAMPSHSESFGLVALEAQASGTPVIATKVGGLLKAVNDGVSGVLVEGHALQHWGEEIVGMVRSPELLAQMSEAAVQHAAQFSWSHNADSLIDSYMHAMQDHEQLRVRNLA